MQPWMSWAPQWHFPWSGAVTQRIQPTNSWFFESIPPTAGDGRIEQKAFDVASYGRQLGLITEVLLDLAGQKAPVSSDAQKSLSQLQDIAARIDALKKDDTSAQMNEIKLRIEKLRRTHEKDYPGLKEELQKAL